MIKDSRVHSQKGYYLKSDGVLKDNKVLIWVGKVYSVWEQVSGTITKY